MSEIQRASVCPSTFVRSGGRAADARLRLGPVLGPWRPFIFGAGSYAFSAERLTLDDYPGQGTTLSRRNVMVGLGLAYAFGTAKSGETFVSWPSPGLGE